VVVAAVYGGENVARQRAAELLRERAQRTEQAAGTPRGAVAQHPLDDLQGQGQGQPPSGPAAAGEPVRLAAEADEAAAGSATSGEASGRGQGAEESEGVLQEEELPPEVLDVTEAVQYLVDSSSRLTFHKGEFVAAQQQPWPPGPGRAPHAAGEQPLRTGCRALRRQQPGGRARCAALPGRLRLPTSPALSFAHPP
jgi:hypothetical protein